MPTYNNQYTAIKYYFEFDASSIAEPIDISSTIDYSYISITGQVNESISIDGTYATLQDFLNAWNNAQSVFSFSILPTPDLKRTKSSVVCIQVTGNTYPPETWVNNSLTLAFDGGEAGQNDLQKLYPAVTTADDQLNELQIIASNVQTTQLGVVSLSVSGAGSIPAGANYIYLKNVGGAAGLFNGVSLPAGEPVTIPTNDNNTLGAVSYDATGTTFFITYT